MQSQLTELLENVRRCEQRNRWVAACVVGCSVLSAALLFFVARDGYPRWVALVALCVSFPLLLWVLQAGVRSVSVSQHDTARLIDTSLDTKDRALSLASLEGVAGEEMRVARELIAQQLAAHISSDTRASAIAPYVMTRAEKRSLRVSGALLVVAVLLAFFRPASPLEALVASIESIEQAHPELPPEVQDAARALVEQLQDPDATTDEIERALATTKEIVSKAISRDGSDRSVVGRSSDSSNRESKVAPPPVKPSPTPKPQSAQSSQSKEKEGSKGGADEDSSSRDAGDSNSKEERSAEEQSGAEKQDGADKNSGGEKQQTSGDSAGGTDRSQQQSGNGQSGEGDSAKDQDKAESQQRQQDGQQGGSSQGGGNSSEERPNAQGQGGGAGSGSSGESNEGQSQDAASNNGQGEGQGEGAASNGGQNDQSTEGHDKEGQGKAKEPGDSKNSGAGNQQSEGQQGAGGQQQGAGQQKGKGEQQGDGQEQKDTNDQRGEKGSGDGNSPGKQSGQPGQQADQKKGQGGAAGEGGLQKLEGAIDKAQKALEKDSTQESSKPESSPDKSAQGGAQQDGAKEGANEGGKKESAKKDGEQKDGAQQDSAAKDSQGMKPPAEGAQPGERDSNGKGKNNDSADAQTEKSPKGTSDSAGGNSPDIDRNAKARPGSEMAEGPTSAGLGGKEAFKDVEVPSADENIDERFTGEESSLEESDAPAQPKTTLEDVTLAKPKSSSSKAKQPIPLEYRDILR